MGINTMIRLLLAIAFVIGCVAAASAQCPGGVCGGASWQSAQVQYYMQPQRVYQQQYYVPQQQQYYSSSQQVTYQSSGPSWSYPGTIAAHLQRDHGIDVAGMSHAQMVQLHNNLHNSQRGRTVVRSVSRPTFFRRW